MPVLASLRAPLAMNTTMLAKLTPGQITENTEHSTTTSSATIVAYSVSHYHSGGS
jgi:hypothetical protein